MSVTDPIADMLTIVRNAAQAKKRWVVFPSTNMRKAIVQVLEREHYIRGFEVVEAAPQSRLKVHLKYDRENKSIINGLKRMSRPGRRMYVNRHEIPRVLGGFGTAILFTSGGVLTDKEARKQGTGGEWVCNIW